MDKNQVFLAPDAGDRNLILGNIEDLVYAAECANNGDCPCDCSCDCACNDCGGIN